MLPVDFLLMVNSIRGCILGLLIVCDIFFCEKRLKIGHFGSDAITAVYPFKVIQGY